MLNAIEAKRLADVSAEKITTQESIWTKRDEHQFNRYLRKIKHWAEKGHTEMNCGTIRPNVQTKLESLGYKIKGCGVAEQSWMEIHWGKNF